MKSSKLLAALTASALLILPTFAAETAKAPLPAGKPAGTKQAALEGDFMKVVLSLAAIGALTAYGASLGGGSTTATIGTSS